MLTGHYVQPKAHGRSKLGLGLHLRPRVRAHCQGRLPVDQGIPMSKHEALPASSSISNYTLPAPQPYKRADITHGHPVPSIKVSHCP